MSELKSYTSTIKPFSAVLWIAWSILWLSISFNLNNNISDLMIVVIIFMTIYTVLRSAFIIDSIEICENGIIYSEHVIWGWSRKNIYAWSNIKYLGFENGNNNKLLLVIQIENVKKKHYINHLYFDPQEAGEVIKQYSYIPDFNIEHFVCMYNENK
jgi:hypothetical protein